MKNVLNEAISIISLSKNEEKNLIKETKNFVQSLLKYIDKKIIVGGSLAKGTLIKKDKQDIDIFVLFDKEEETKELEKYLKKLDLEYDVLHGSRDYFKIKKGKVFFEIVPLVKIKRKEDVKNVTDFSPLHVDYVKKKIKENPKFVNEIKLAKAFCLANEIYGAESYIKGFSGYAVEILILYYRSFYNFLKRIQKDRFIDIEKHFKNEKEARREINEQKILSPLVLIDPVYKYRNLCAGLSKESFQTLIKKAKDFLKKPSINFFIRKEFNKRDFFEKAKKNNARILILNLSSIKEKEDVAATKMKKFFDYLKKEFERKEQKILDEKFIFLRGNKAKAYFSLVLKENIKVFGPKKELKEALEKFKKKRREIYFEKGRAFSYEDFNLKNFLEKQKEIAESMDVYFKVERPGEDSNL